MIIKNLVKILTPPSAPSESGKGKAWPKFAGRVEFPADYVEFINTYGSGRIANFVVIFNPFAEDENINFFEQFRLVLEDFRFLMGSAEYYKFVLCPQGEGLIPLGVTDNGDYFFWVFNSEIDSGSWSTAMVSSRSPDVEYFNCGLVSLLEKILNGSIKAKSLPSSFPGLIDFEPL